MRAAFEPSMVPSQRRGPQGHVSRRTDVCRLSAPAGSRSSSGGLSDSERFPQGGLHVHRARTPKYRRPPSHRYNARVGLFALEVGARPAAIQRRSLSVWCFTQNAHDSSTSDASQTHTRVEFQCLRLLRSLFSDPKGGRRLLSGHRCQPTRRGCSSPCSPRTGSNHRRTSRARCSGGPSPSCRRPGTRA